MKALVRRSTCPNDIKLMEKDTPTPSVGQLLVEVAYSGICTSDVFNAARQLQPNDRLRPPVILGHEGAGIVVATGPEVSRFKIGDPVTAETTYESCGKCRYCKTGRLNLCPERKSLGSTADGFFAQFVVVPEQSAHHLGALSLEEGAAIEPLACATHAVMERAKLKGTEVVGVFGPGMMGLLVSEVAKSCGCKVCLICTSHSLARVKALNGFEPDLIINRDNNNLKESVYDFSRTGFDIVFECSGSLTAARDALAVTRPGGCFLTLGEYPSSMDINLSAILITREITLKGSRSSTPWSWKEAIGIAQERKVHLQPLITHKLEMSQWEQGFALVSKKEGIKILLCRERVKLKSIDQKIGLRLDKDLIAVGIKTSCKEEVFSTLFDKLYQKGYVKNTYLKAVLEREASFPTGLIMKDGIVAIPHVDTCYCVKPGIAIGFLENPIEMKEMGKPDNTLMVDGIFMLSVVKAEDQVHWLRQLIEVLQCEGTLSKIKQSNSPEEVCLALNEAGLQ